MFLHEAASAIPLLKVFPVLIHRTPGPYPVRHRFQSKSTSPLKPPDVQFRFFTKK